MKKVVYRKSSSETQEFLLTNKEMADAVAAWSADRNYSCLRLKNTLNRFILYTTDRKYEKRFQHFIDTLPNGEVLQIIFDHKAGQWYEFDKFTDYEEVVENLVTREKGGDAPLYFTPIFRDKEKTEKLLKVLSSADDFFDKGGELGY